MEKVITITKTFGGSLFGINAHLIDIEVSIVQGTRLFMVGLPDSAIKESEHRIESVLKYIGRYMPRQRVIVNLAPADVKKEGAAYDLPIALSILNCSGQVILEDLNKYIVMGELSLDGNLRPIRGALPIAIEARKLGLKGLVLPYKNAHEAALVKGIDVIPINHINEAIDFFSRKIYIEPMVVDARKQFESNDENYDIDFSDVQGQDNIKRGLEVAAAGGHNVIMIGPPGSGKTMLAKRIVTILPKMNIHESLETTKIYSVSGKIKNKPSLSIKRPFRSPHHTISDSALVGGGSIPQPGELSLAHNGVLFLDEIPEFKRSVLEVMRQPLEEKSVTISRTKMSVEYPTNFMLIASMNPCPCGYYNHPNKECTCPSSTVVKYLNKISGPLMDRIDIQLEVVPVSYECISKTEDNEKSEKIKDRVIRARSIQERRFAKYPHVYNNASMNTNLAKKYCILSEDAKNILKLAMENLKLSSRAYDRIIKVSRTIADLDQSKNIEEEHVCQAIGYRDFDREGWWGQ